MKIDIDRSGCIGCGLCVNTCPAVFRMADDGMAEVIAQPQGEVESAAEEAAQGCPVQVISVK